MRVLSVILLLGSLLVAFGMPVVPEEADVQEHAASSRGKAPAPPAKEDVSKVWSDMKSWGKTGPAKMGGADVAMYMQDNHMTMDATQFTMNGGSDKQMDSFFGSTPTSNSKVKKMTVKAGPVSLGRFSLRDSMTMTDTTQITNGKKTHDDKTVVGTEKKAEQVELLELSSAQRSEVGSKEQGSSSARDLYMYGNEMSMKTTVFTMNVGTASEATEDLQASASTASVDTLNINMYMHENDMLMDGTKFKMNVANDMLKKAEEEELLQVGSVASKGIRGGDLVRLALLQVPWVLGSEAASLAKDKKPATSTDVQSIWDWLKSWSTSTGPSKSGTVDINMFMHNNSMSMTNTDFAFNVGTAGTELLGTSDSLDHAAQDQAAHAASAPKKGAAPPPKYMYREAASMKDTTFTMGVGELQESAQESVAAQNWQSVNMYMANNKMSMTDTIFRMNVGSGSVALTDVQGGASEDTASNTRAAGQTLNCKSLNVRMYMYKNSMAMKTTEFTWNVKSSEQLETSDIETRVSFRKGRGRSRRSRPSSGSTTPPHWGVRRITKPPKAAPNGAKTCAKWCKWVKTAKWSKKCGWKRCAGCSTCAVRARALRELQTNRRRFSALPDGQRPGDNLCDGCETTRSPTRGRGRSSRSPTRSVTSSPRPPIDWTPTRGCSATNVQYKFYHDIIVYCDDIGDYKNVRFNTTTRSINDDKYDVMAGFCMKVADAEGKDADCLWNDTWRDYAGRLRPRDNGGKIAEQTGGGEALKGFDIGNNEVYSHNIAAIKIHCANALQDCQIELNYLMNPCAYRSGVGCVPV